ncbi:4-carboxymuconolactone decarboxylase [Mangrovibacter sp. MFB070]|uniref:carboxymuconolactone decarboxylase family protein n=1 Tax=Mangrovibacter sp. MFB070 TaxID=1224318 RepID=UPI0004D4DE92|nr:carboxymuconolactone decarboxylase family protein [Mangrovibacter sp. MFB070]KEA52283.1 4-carboxymuconolactone decarboxylase [Mangrovibacter sp. MFB070]
MQQSRYERGLTKLAEIDGEAGENVVNGLADICPDLGRYIVEFGFGDIYSRPQLNLKSREIATVAALTAMGHCEPQLAVHIQGALNVGCSREEITEVMLQMALYAGFPAALKAVAVARGVFAQADRVAHG